MFDRIAFIFRYIFLGEETIPEQFRRTRIMIIPEDVRNNIARVQKEHKSSIHDAFKSAYSHLFPKRTNQSIPGYTATTDALLRPYVHGIGSNNTNIVASAPRISTHTIATTIPTAPVASNAPTIDEVQQYVNWTKARKPSLLYRIGHSINNFADNADSLIDYIWNHKIVFGLVVYMFFIGCVTILYSLGALPEVFILESKADATAAVLTYVGNATSTKESASMQDANAEQRTISVSESNIEGVSGATVTEVEPSTNIVKKTNIAKKAVKTTPNQNSNTAAVVQAPIAPVITPTPTQKPIAPVIQPVQVGEDPVRVIIDRVGLNTRVTNPEKTDVDYLDAKLKLGAVRYPGSPGLGAGNTFLLAHSTSFKVVNNQAYKAFNGLKYTDAGDIIRVQTLSKEYRYRVTSMRMATKSEIFVPFTKGEATITLVTCNVLGAKEDRYVVDGVLIEVVPLTDIGI